MQHSKSWQTALRLAAILVGGFLFLRLFGAILLPFALGLIPAKAASRAADRLPKRRGLSHKLTAIGCVALFYILIFLVLFFLLPYQDFQ